MTDNKPEIEPTAEKIRSSKNVTIAFKLNGSNYSLWARLMKVSISGRGAYRHITRIPTPPDPGEKGYNDWEEIDLIVFSWIVDNMETNIIADFAHHQTAKSLWDSLAVTFASSADSYIIYDLRERANRITQGDLSLEAYWSHLHGLWIDIDRCPHKTINCCDKEVTQYRDLKNELRLFKFLTGLNEKYDGIRRDILKEDPYPSVDAAYGWVKREAARLKIMPPASNSPITAAGNDSSSAAATLHRLQSLGKQQTGQIEVMVFPLWNAKTHERNVLSTSRISRLVGCGESRKGESCHRSRKGKKSGGDRNRGQSGIRPISGEEIGNQRSPNRRRQARRERRRKGGGGDDRLSLVRWNQRHGRR